MKLSPKFSDNKKYAGYIFYKNTFGGEEFKKLESKHPELIIIDSDAIDCNGNKIEGAIAIYVSSFDLLNRVMLHNKLIL